MALIEKLSAIADAIRGKTGKTEEMTLDQMAQSVGAVYEAGKKSEYDFFWDGLQHNGDGTTDYRCMFFYWRNEIYKPKYPIYTTKSSVAEAFKNAQIVSTLVDVDLSKTTTCNSLFAYCGELITITKLIVAEQNIFNTAFLNCWKLKNLTVNGTFGNSIDLAQSVELSKASIQSVFNALSTTATGKTATFNSNAVNNAFTAEEWSALVATRNNWTINLV